MNRPAGAGRFSGIRDLVTASVLVALNLWIERGSFEPLAEDGGPIAYGLVSPSFQALAASFAVAAILVLIVHGLVIQRSGTSLDGAFRASHTRYWFPVWWTAVTLVPLVNLLPFAAGRLPLLTYLAYDLRWGWWAVTALAVVRRIDPPIRFAASETLRVVTLVIVSVVSAWMFTPNLRLSEVWHGDEPKYLRYCENFYQGHGFDIAPKKSLPDLSSADAPRVLDNIAHLMRALPEEARLVAGDVRRALGFDSSPPLLAGEPNPGLFFEGKHPGTVYQLHNPGLSFLLFPGYYLDRRATGSGVGYQEEIPANLPAVHLTLLALYAAYGLALYRLLARWTPNHTFAWTAALVGVLSLPAGAFAFQIYPEIAAGIGIFVLVTWLIRGGQNTFLAVTCGLVAGFLPWLHVRFGLVTLVFAAWVFATPSQSRRSRTGFVIGAGLLLAALSLYTYRLTGHFLPSATYGAEAPLTIGRVPHGLVAFLFDRVWGLFPHAPVYLVALAGIGITWRKRRRDAIFLLLVFAAVMVPAAAHGFWAAGATPGRYLVAAAPLLLLFGADAWSEWSSRRLFQAAVIVTLVVSLETVVRYNLDHVKEVGPMVASGLSGWRPNMLFPSLGTEVWTFTFGPRTSRDYVVAPQRARERLLASFASIPRCAICAFSSRGLAPPSEVFDNAVGFVNLRVESNQARAGQPFTIQVRPRAASGEYIVADLVVDMGDGTVMSARRHFGDYDLVHAYADARDYTVTAVARASDRQVTEELVITVRPSTP